MRKGNAGKALIMVVLAALVLFAVFALDVASEEHTEKPGLEPAARLADPHVP